MNTIGTVNVKPISAKLKRDTESVGSMDPFCVVKLGTSTAKTKVHKDAGKFPSWNENLPLRRNGESMLTIEVWDEDLVSENDLIGEVTIPLSEILEKKSITGWYILSYKGKNAGEILIEFKWFPDGNDSLEKAKFLANTNIPTQVNTGMLMMQGSMSGVQTSPSLSYNPMIGTGYTAMPQQTYYMPQQQFIPTQQQYMPTQQFPTQQYMPPQYNPTQQQYSTSQQQFPTTMQQQYPTTQQQLPTTTQQQYSTTQQQQYSTTQQQQFPITTKQQYSTTQQQQFPTTTQQQYAPKLQPTTTVQQNTTFQYQSDPKQNIYPTFQQQPNTMQQQYSQQQGPYQKPGGY